jgi:hypothetical protein
MMPSFADLISVLFHVTISCEDYMVFMINEWISVVHWWNNVDRQKLECLEKVVPVTVVLIKFVSVIQFLLFTGLNKFW